jgi:hypothetical protein
VNNNTVVNRGVSVDRIAAVTHREIHQLPIHDAPSWSGRGIHRTEVAVYRPELRSPAPRANIVAQKIDNRHPTIQHLPLESPKTVQPSSRSASSNFAGFRNTALASSAGSVKGSTASLVGVDERGWGNPHQSQWPSNPTASAHPAMAAQRYAGLVDRAVPVTGPLQATAVSEARRTSEVSQSSPARGDRSLQPVLVTRFSARA